MVDHYFTSPLNADSSSFGPPPPPIMMTVGTPAVYGVWKQDVRLQSGRTREKRPENIRQYAKNRGDS